MGRRIHKLRIEMGLIFISKFCGVYSLRENAEHGLGGCTL